MVDFALSDEQQLLRDTARRLLGTECRPAVLRACLEDPSSADPLWAHLREYAALGIGPLCDLVVFLDELGYAAAPGPFLASVVLAAPLLAAVSAPELDSVLAGEAVATVAIAGATGEWSPNDDTVKTFVLEADRADFAAVVTRGPRVIVGPVPRDRLRFVPTIDATRRGFELGPIAIGEIANSAQHSLTVVAWRDWLARAWVALAAETIGTARRIFDMTLEHVKERVQFDVPIGSFQAVQHRMADVSLAIERATSAVQYAAMTADAGDPDWLRAAHVAKAAANAAAARAGKAGHQFHGGIGYTWEHDLHLFTKRAFASEHLLGTSSWHHDRLADLLLAP